MIESYCQHTHISLHYCITTHLTHSNERSKKKHLQQRAALHQNFLLNPCTGSFPHPVSGRWWFSITTFFVVGLPVPWIEGRAYKQMGHVLKSDHLADGSMIPAEKKIGCGLWYKKYRILIFRLFFQSLFILTIFIYYFTLLLCDKRCLIL